MACWHEASSENSQNPIPKNLRQHKSLKKKEITSWTSGFAVSQNSELDDFAVSGEKIDEVVLGGAPWDVSNKDGRAVGSAAAASSAAASAAASTTVAAATASSATVKKILKLSSQRTEETYKSIASKVA